MNNNKVTGLNIFLGAIGIIILSCLIILPPVFRMFIPKEDNKLDDKPIQEDINKTILCSKSDNSEAANVVTDFELYINNSKLNLVAITKTTSFDGFVEISTDEFERIKESFNNGNDFFYSYNIEENKVTENYRINILKNLNLPATVENIEINTSYDELNNILINNGYICK